MDGKKTAHVNVRVSERELAAIRRRARAAGMTASEYVRRRALDDADRPVVEADVGLLRAMYADLRKCGSNLNQCAKALNSGRPPAGMGPSLQDALDSVAAASRDVSGLIAEVRHGAREPAFDQS